MLDEQWPAALASHMLKACLRTMDKREPLPQAPNRGGRKRLLQAEIAGLERRRDALLSEVTALDAYARVLDPFWVVEARRIQADIQRFLEKLSEVKPPQRHGDEDGDAGVPSIL